MERVVNVFGQALMGQQAVIDRVRREAKGKCMAHSCPVVSILDDCVESVVEALWERRVKAFVPFLALRQIRCCIRTGSCDCGER
jgi:predicted nucleotide-binding protein (sugar kinase/HSP70/actin superfamily)